MSIYKIEYVIYQFGFSTVIIYFGILISITGAIDGVREGTATIIKKTVVEAC